MAEHIIYGDGVHDDTEALQAYFNGEAVVVDSGGKFVGHLNGTYKIGIPIIASPHKVKYPSTKKWARVRYG